jgi:hypothetical protein
MVKSPVLNGRSHLMVCALAISPPEYTHREQCAAETETGADALAPNTESILVIVPAGGTSAARL